jgi:lysophospholipase L1-like esterase
MALEQLGVPYLNLVQGFRSRAESGEVLFFEADGHPNRRGYALIADLVLAHLKSHAKQQYGLRGLAPTAAP